MIELVNRVNYLDDKLKDLKSKEETLIGEIAILKMRLLQLEDTLEISGISIDEPVKNYGGSK